MENILVLFARLGGVVFSSRGYALKAPAKSADILVEGPSHSNTAFQEGVASPGPKKMC